MSLNKKSPVLWFGIACIALGAAASWWIAREGPQGPTETDRFIESVNQSLDGAKKDSQQLSAQAQGLEKELKARSGNKETNSAIERTGK